MAPEERMLERFTRERQRASKGISFNLMIIRVHRGRTARPHVGTEARCEQISALHFRSSGHIQDRTFETGNTMSISAVSQGADVENGDSRTIDTATKNKTTSMV